MRALICLCLLTGMLAAESPLPGRDQAFLSRILANSEGGSQPWKTFRVPEETASAVVEVIGEYSREELRQIAFEEFLVWFREDLKRFWLRHGSAVPASSWSNVSAPIHRYGGNPVGQNVPLGRVRY